MKPSRSRVTAALAVGAAAIAIPLTASPASAADVGSPTAMVKYEWVIAGGGMTKSDCLDALANDVKYGPAVDGFCFTEDGNTDPGRSVWAEVLKKPL
ncbi:hypothetical protein AB0L99_21535 [Streptomyces sp. NPDC051954]|uniref:hypothetical protein n=1 Tax=unclassified Streptomyces TaxID=2593676 RepID=UPI00341F7E6B